MAVYTGNVNRVTGLSGIDTDTMINKMMKAEGIKYEKLQKQEIWVTWKQEAYREVIKGVQDFQDKWFSSTNPKNNLGFETAWNNFNTSVKDASGKDSSAVLIKNSTVNGKYELDITQIAKTESLTGKAVASGKLVTSKTADQIYDAIHKAKEVNYEITVDGVKKNITLQISDLTSAAGNSNGEKFIEAFQKKLDDSFGKGKVTVAKDSNNKVTIEGKGSGGITIAEGKDISSDSMSTTHNDILKSGKEGKYELKVSVGGQEYTVSTNFTSSDDADARVKKVVEAFQNATDSSNQKVDISKKLSLKISKDGDNLKIENLSSNENYKIKGTFTETGGTQSTFNEIDLENKSNLDKLGFDSSRVSTVISDRSSLTQILGDGYKTFFNDNKDADGVVKLNLGGKEISLTADDTIGTLTRKVDEAGSSVKLSYNQVTGRFKIESKQSGANGGISISDGTSKKFLEQLGIDVDTKSNNDVYVQGQDAIFKVDGVEVTKSSNDINMNGLEMTLNSTGKVTVTSTTNEEETVKKIQDFVSDYNKLIGDIEGRIKQKREKTGKYGYYEPLLPEQKDSMKEAEIKKWEEKAKTGLLYNDEILRGVLSNLRNLVYEKIDIGGSKLSLSDLGISHGKNYSTGKLEIDEKTLKKAISERGDDIKKMFTQEKTGFAAKIKNVIDGTIGKNGSLRLKAGIKETSSVSNNLLSKELKEISKKMSREKQRLYDKEMKYYKMFSKMESIVTKQNNQLNMLTTLLSNQ